MHKSNVLPTISQIHISITICQSLHTHSYKVYHLYISKVLQYRVSETYPQRWQVSLREKLKVHWSPETAIVHPWYLYRQRQWKRELVPRADQILRWNWRSQLQVIGRKGLLNRKYYNSVAPLKPEREQYVKRDKFVTLEALAWSLPLQPPRIAIDRIHFLN